MRGVDEMVSEVLQRPTLVLNRSWQPVNVATVARALVMVWSGAARVVDPVDYQLYDWEDWARADADDGQEFVRTVSRRIRVPEVITLADFNRLPSTTVAFSRRNLFKRDRMTCQYCGRRPRGDELTIDHVVPRSHGGESNWENCVLACVPCNQNKADRSPEKAGLKLLNRPKQPNWNPIYSQHTTGYQSWAKFISDAYWSAELVE
jgi:5-methylcytosine-specific restriction endonuclease McrA|tara:strand:+ start:2327 stop:2941 length:615 start_codon:yes stop_codon:yes gene_type:complete